MTWFRDFTTPLWEIFGGNLLLLITLIFYIAWWTLEFGPKGKTAGAGLFMAAAVFVGFTAIAVLALGINALSPTTAGIPVPYILIGAVALYFLLLAVTTTLFHRAHTAELPLIVLWVALEGAAVAVLQGNGRLGTGQTALLIVLIGLATLVGLVCYILHYRFDEPARFWNGLIPLIGDAGMVAAFLAILGVS